MAMTLQYSQQRFIEHHALFCCCFLFAAVWENLARRLHTYPVVRFILSKRSTFILPKCPVTDDLVRAANYNEGTVKARLHMRFLMRFL